jgi:hypothetical protein
MLGKLPRNALKGRFYAEPLRKRTAQQKDKGRVKTLDISNKTKYNVFK